MNMRKNIGLRLSQARKVKGLTQEQLAELASFSVSEISRIETGRAETPLTTLQKLCDALQIGLDFLLYDCFPDKTGFTNHHSADHGTALICIGRRAEGLP